MALSLKASFIGTLDQDLARDAAAILSASQRAVIGAADDTRDQARAHVAQRLGARAGNLIARRIYLGRDGTVSGYVHSRWRPRDESGGFGDVLEGFEQGRTITARGRYMAIPLPEAGRLVGRKRVTPQLFEQATGMKLVLVRRPGRPALLYATPARISRSGRVVRSRSRTLRGAASFPVFVLVERVKMPQRLDFGSVRQYAENRLAERFLGALAAASVGA